MDIIDIMIAKSLSSQGQIETYAAKARRAAQDAQSAATNAQTAVNNIESIIDETTTNNTLASQTIADLNAALEDLPNVDEEISKLSLDVTTSTANNTINKNLVVHYPDNSTDTVENIEKLYKEAGENEDGAMTQKATKAYVSSVAQQLQTAINNLPASGSSTTIINNLGPDNSGKIVIIDTDGSIKSGTIDENEIIEALIRTGAYTATNAVGITVDYENKVVERTQESTNFSAGAHFNNYAMYGGRMRCNVDNSGRITAFYGDVNYAEDGTNGQVMVYQPKFYYQRTIIKSEKNTVGRIVRKESYILSPVPQTGFKLHPLFKNKDGEELDYVLLPAFDGAVENNQLVSLAGKKPVSNITIDEAEALAQARGNNWHILTMEAESANQMLEMVEFGSLNGQLSLEAGISDLPANSTINCASITGSTSALGNASGAAASTVNDVNGTQTTYSVAGKRAISYRGVENPWGNIWHFIGNVNISGDGTKAGGVPYVCTDYNYNHAGIPSNYESVGFSIPSIFGWISALGYGDPKYDWVLMPAECSSVANSVSPIGDNLWTNANLNGTTIVLAGGTWAFNDSDGPFYYGCDHKADESSQHSYGTKLMYIPKKGTIYNDNYELWLSKQGG